MPLREVVRRRRGDGMGDGLVRSMYHTIPIISGLQRKRQTGKGCRRLGIFIHCCIFIN